MASAIDTAAKRAKLPVRKNPFWTSVAGARGGVTLGYRRTSRGAGAWIAKIAVEGQRLEERIGTADDARAPTSAIGYRGAVSLALDWSRQQFAALEAQHEAAAAGKKPTVRLAVEAYSKSKPNAADRLRRHVLSDDDFADLRLSQLRAGAIEAWRDRLPIRGVARADESGDEGAQEPAKEISPATVNRLMNDLRAALNAAAVKHRRELPAQLPAEIRVGTKAIPAVAHPRRQLLRDDDVRALVEAAFEVDESGDFGRLAMLKAASGARHSQIAALTVGDLQAELGRVMMPGSKKGRAAQAKPPVAIQLAPDVIARLLPVTRGRALHEPLLMRWHHRKVGKCSWVRDVRRKWGPAYEVDTFWPATLERAGLPADTVMYAFRHSSIVRGLRAMLPVRLVAALHDTSTEMIEEHYAAFIVDVTEDLARRATISLASKPPPRALAA